MPGEWNTSIERFAPRPDARIRLFCFHHAGGAASYFRDWPALFPASVELCCVQQPGRERLFYKSKHSDLEELVEHTLGAMDPWLDRPFAFLGHSFGALVAYASAVKLSVQNHKTPEHLFLSGCRAPDLPLSLEMRSTMNDGELATKIAQLGGVPRELVDSRAFMEMFLSILRSDIQIIEQFNARPNLGKVHIPITAFGGSEDISVSNEDIVQWSRFTTLEFDANFFSGGHFFISENAGGICNIVSKKLNAL